MYWGKGGSTHKVLLDTMESKSFLPISSSSLTDCPHPLSHSRSIASLSIFYLYYHAKNSIDLDNCMLPLFLHPRCTRLSSFFHPYSVQLSNASVNHSHFFSSKLWNSLPASVFPTSYDLTWFKGEVSKHSSLPFGEFSRTCKGTGN